jgi:hypothetical protein
MLFLTKIKKKEKNSLALAKKKKNYSFGKRVLYNNNKVLDP